MAECKALLQVDKVDRFDSRPPPPKKEKKERKKHPIFKVSSKLGVMDEEMEGEASELIFLYLFNFLCFYIKASKLILDDVEDFGVGRFSKSTMGFYPSLE